MAVSYQMGNLVGKLRIGRKVKESTEQLTEFDIFSIIFQEATIPWRMALQRGIHSFLFLIFLLAIWGIKEAEQEQINIRGQPRFLI